MIITKKFINRDLRNKRKAVVDKITTLQENKKYCEMLLNSLNEERDKFIRWMPKGKQLNNGVTQELINQLEFQIITTTHDIESINIAIHKGHELLKQVDKVLKEDE